MRLHHPFGLAGLLLNTFGALALLRFTGKWNTSPLTAEQVMPLLPMMPAARRSYRIEFWGFRLSLLALAVGFALQLVDLLIA